MLVGAADASLALSLPGTGFRERRSPCPAPLRSGSRNGEDALRRWHRDWSLLEGEVRGVSGNGASMRRVYKRRAGLPGRTAVKGILGEQGVASWAQAGPVSWTQVGIRSAGTLRNRLQAPPEQSDGPQGPEFTHTIQMDSGKRGTGWVRDCERWRGVRGRRNGGWVRMALLYCR